MTDDTTNEEKGRNDSRYIANELHSRKRRSLTLEELKSKYLDHNKASA